MRCLHLWTDKVSNNEVLERNDIPSMFTLLRQRRLRWKMGESPKTCCTMSCNLDRCLLADPSWASRMSVRETCLPLVCQQATGRHTLQISRALQVEEIRLKAEADERRAKRKVATKKTASAPATSDYICGRCGCVCLSRIGLLSRERECWSQLC